MRNPVRLLCILAVLALAGCSVYPQQFTLDTQPVAGSEPLIYAPGTMAGDQLSILVPDVSMACPATRIDISLPGFGETPKDPDVRFSVELSQRLVDQRDLGTEPISVYAKFDARDFRMLVEAIASRRGEGKNERTSIRASLATAITSVRKGCELKFLDDKTTESAALVAPYTAERILHGLPRPFSGVAGFSYNHRMVGKSPSSTDVGNDGFSLDIAAGMRLRLENALPIAPSGINGGDDAHPSSVAASGYVYFNPITAPQICDTYVGTDEEKITFATNICSTSPHDETTVYLSPAAEMLRYGARQMEQREKNPSVSTPGLIYERGVDVSSMIDLMERAQPGRGVWKYWRLWSPYNRKTTLTKAISAGGAGSEDDPGVPILIAANDISTLDEILKAEPGYPPCKMSDSSPLAAGQRTKWQCYYFHYRVVPIPEITVRVNGAERWVPVGTTLHDIVAPRLLGDRIQGDAAMGYYSDSTPDLATRLAQRSHQRFLKQVRIKRMFDGAPYPLRAENLDATSSSSAFLRLQLLSGDDISW